MIYRKHWSPLHFEEVANSIDEDDNDLSGDNDEKVNHLSAIGVFIRLAITSAYRDRRIYTPNDTAYANSGGPDLCT